METPQPPVTTPQPPAPEPQEFPFQFSGMAGEYFRIWIVNVALTIVTIGIYSAWAKVRNKRYFYGSTLLAGGSFEYTASPVSILKGRLLVFGVFVAYQLAATFQPILAGVMALLIIALVPWVVIRAVGFNHRYSAYRGLRFHFDGRYWEAFRVYLLWTLAIVASFGLAYPYVAWRRKQFLIERSRYGRSGFGFDGEVGWFYLVYIIGSLLYVGVMMGIAIIATGVIAAIATMMGLEPEAGGAELGEGGQIAVFTFGVVTYALLLVSFIMLNTGIQAMIANHVWGHTRVANVKFDLDLNIWRICWIQVSNIAAIIFSVGLLIPWARVRMVRYRLSCFTMTAVPEDLERFVASERESLTATGDELGEALDLDLGL